MVRNGEYSLHWYSADSFENSSALTEITAECDGNYKFSSYFAGEKSTCKIRIYVNNVLKDENTCKPVAYNSWDKLSVMAYAKKAIEYNKSLTGRDIEEELKYPLQVIRKDMVQLMTVLWKLMKMFLIKNSPEILIMITK